MLRNLASVLGALAAFVAAAAAPAEELEGEALVEALRRGGHTLYVRHAAGDVVWNPVSQEIHPQPFGKQSRQVLHVFLHNARHQEDVERPGLGEEETVPPLDPQQVDVPLPQHPLHISRLGLFARRCAEVVQCLTGTSEDAHRRFDVRQLDVQADGGRGWRKTRTCAKRRSP